MDASGEEGQPALPGARERRLIPGGLRSGRHHVLMADAQDRLQSGISARPFIEQAPFVHLDQIKRIVEQSVTMMQTGALRGQRGAPS